MVDPGGGAAQRQTEALRELTERETAEQRRVEEDIELKIGQKDDTMTLQGSDGMSIHRPIGSPIEQRNTAKGNPNAIVQYARPLNNRQKSLLDALPIYDSRVTVSKGDVNMRDLAALTAQTGVEYALFTRRGERMIVRGNSMLTNIGPESAKEMADAGWRWSGHTHPGLERMTTTASTGDYVVLAAFGQKRSVILNSKGLYEVFGEE